MENKDDIYITRIDQHDQPLIPFEEAEEVYK
jgi:hypothetical protein